MKKFFFILFFFFSSRRRHTRLVRDWSSDVCSSDLLSVTLIKSFYGRLPAHRATVSGLGLKRINHTVELQDTPEVRGMINKVSYLLKVEG